MDLERFSAEVLVLSDQLAPLLTDKHPAVQSGALGHCVATCIASHWVPGDTAATAKLREVALDSLVRLVRDLVPACAKELGTWEE